MRLLLRRPWKRAVICFLDKKPSVDALMASRMRSVVWSPVDCAEERGGACGAVVPDGEGSLKVRQADDGAAVENSVYGAEAQNLGFGPTGGGAIEAGTDLAQGRVTVVPESSRLVVADEAESVRIADPIESAAEFGGDGG